MSYTFPTLSAVAASFLFFAGGSALAASPPASTDDEAILALQSAYTRAVVSGEQADLHRDLFATVLQRVKRSHAAEVDLAAFAATARNVIEPLPLGSGDPVDVFKRAINEALRTLDPHSRYYDARSSGNARPDSNTSFSGVGLELQTSDGALRVAGAIPDSPAARAGLVPGDLIVRVDDKPLDGLPLAEAVERMRGPPGTPVSITILRAGTPAAFTVSLTRDTIRRPLLRWSMDGGVLVLRLAGFTPVAAASLTKAIADATASEQPRAVVLDLRGNPGGLLREAVKVADAFLMGGEIVSLRGNTPARRYAWQADADELLAGLPMVVLIDGRSASASELVADALQHNGRATVMGQRSFGKGSVQTIFPLGAQYGSLKLTTAIYHGPSGQTVHRTGVAPDIELMAPTTAERPADGAPARKAKARVDPARCTPRQASDPALACAVAYLRSAGIDAFVTGLSP